MNLQGDSAITKPMECDGDCQAQVSGSFFIQYFKTAAIRPRKILTCKFGHIWVDQEEHLVEVKQGRRDIGDSLTRSSETVAIDVCSLLVAFERTWRSHRRRQLHCLQQENRQFQNTDVNKQPFRYFIYICNQIYSIDSHIVTLWYSRSSMPCDFSN